MDLFKRLAALFSSPQDITPTKALVSPDWFAEGQQAAQKADGQKAPQAVFEALYQRHLYACRNAKVRPTARYGASERFKEGWKTIQEQSN